MSLDDKNWEIEKERMRKYERWVENVWGDSSQKPDHINAIVERMIEQASGDEQEALRRLLSKHEELRMLSISTLGLNEEAGEVTGPIKKWIRNPIKNPIDRNKIIDEAGDVLYYLTKLLGWVGASLDDAMTANEAKINVRYNGDECPRCGDSDHTCSLCKGANVDTVPCGACNGERIIDGNYCRICRGTGRKVK